MERLRNVVFKPSYWSFEETEDKSKLYINIGGMTKDGKTVFVRVQNFHPFVYLELPSKITWDKLKCSDLFDYFQSRMKSKAPLEYKMLLKDKLHYREKTYTLFLPFHTHSAGQRDFNDICSKSKALYIEKVGNFTGGEFKVHEQNVDPIIKFATRQNIKLSGWIKVKESISDDDRGLSAEDRKYTTADIDIYANWKNVTPYDQKEVVITPLVYCSFDIECYSKNHNSKLPDPYIPENVIFQISMIYGLFGYPENKMKKYLLTLFDPPDIEGVKVRRWETEEKLLLDFAYLITHEDNDIFLGYNIMKFDWNYIIIRAEELGIYPKIARIGRLLNEKAMQKKISWSSSAYGQQEFRYFDCHGRTNMDLLPEIERNYKLPTYSLNAVSEFFLGEQKEDITPRQLFMLYQISKEILPIVQTPPTQSQLKKIKIRINDIMLIRRVHGEVKRYRRALLNSNPENIKELIRKAVWITGKYCVKDTLLPIWLAEKLNLWTTMEEMSNVMNVPATYLHTRGQQIKVLAQVYRETIKENVIIPYNPPSDSERYQGAIVIEANPGDYTNVATLDFASLYPTTMIAFNICYTTILKDNDPTPDSECHVLKWSDHVGCKHDPQKRKKKEDEILCKDHHYRFRKMKIVIHKDGSVEYQNEGIMPRMERRLLTERKAVKKEMFKAQARLAMQKGKATEKEIKYYESQGWEIIEKGSLSDKETEILEVIAVVLNAKQSALKVSANSMYGAMGVKRGYMPLIPGAASVTAMGRKLIMMAIERIKKEFPFTKLVYGDTDSCMLKFEGKTLRESFALARKASSVATHYIKCYIVGIDEDCHVTLLSTGEKIPISKAKSSQHLKDLSYEDKIKVLEYELTPIDLEFENMYGRFLLLTKKRYIAYVVNVEGEILSVTKKGVVLARRDNCEYLRLVYKKLALAVLDKSSTDPTSEEDVMNIIYDQVNLLFTRKIPDSQLIIYTGVKNITDYADHIKQEDKKGRRIIKIPIDENKNPIEDISGPLDPRLVYPNYPQVLLSLKMLRRGDDVPPNTRLEYLYLHVDNWQYQGEKAEDYTYYRENKIMEFLKPDLLHYVEKQLTNPITELLRVKYPREIIPHEKLDDSLSRVIRNIREPIFSQKIARTRNFLKERPTPVIKEKRLRTKKGNIYTFRGIFTGDSIVGWGVGKYLDGYRKDVEQELDKMVKDLNTNGLTDFEGYNFKSKAAKVESIIISSQIKGKLEINPKVHSELIDVCKKWKARDILNRLYRQNDLRIRPSKHPSRTGPKIPEKYPIITKCKIGKYPPGTFGKVHKVTEVIPKKEYKHDIVFDDEEIITNVLRDRFTTYRYRDSTIMKDILDARANYYKFVKDILES